MCLPERNTLSRARRKAARFSDRRTRERRRMLDLLCIAVLLLLAFLAQDVLACVLDALALVGLRLAVSADLGRDLADLLPVGAVDDDLGRLGQRDGDALGDGIADLVAG